MRRDALVRQHNTTSERSLCCGVKFGLGGKENWIEATRMRLLKSLLQVTLRDRIPNENKKTVLLPTENMMKQP